MQRKLEFRAWDETQKYMAYQGTPDLETIQSFMFHFGDKKLMLYTGFKDFNCKEIYEGDIVEVSNRNNPEDKLIGEISRSDCFEWQTEWLVASLELSGFIRVGDPVVIIGNIYENPELLK